MEEAFQKLVQGLCLVGNALNSFVHYALSLLGLDVPDYVIWFVTILMIILLVWKLGGAINKVILCVLIFIAVSQGLGILTPLLGWK